jgi:DNA mismatch repair protein MutL
VYNLPAQADFSQASVLARAREILGPEVADSLVYGSCAQMGLHLFITPADKLVGLRDFQYCFVNRRPVDCKTIQQAIYKAYQNARPKDRHPAFLMYLTLSPADFDVNIHPQKRDIRFVHEHDVFNFIMREAGNTIFNNGSVIAVSAPEPKTETPVEKPQPVLPPITPPQEIAENLTPMQIYARTYGYLSPKYAQQKKFPVTADFQAPVFELRETEDPLPYVADNEEKQEPAPATSPSQSQPPQPDAPSWYSGPYRYIGQLHKSYLLFENPQGLVLIDQHAAQERVLFEKYMDAFEKHQVITQPLMFPVHVDLTPSNAQALLSWGAWLKNAGFEIEPFSPRTVLVRTMPHNVRLKEDDMKAFILSLAEVAGDPTKTTDALKRRIIALLACKRAVKAHDALSAGEADALLENMKKCKDGMHCPHGRPCVAQLTIKEADKLFGR